MYFFPLLKLRLFSLVDGVSVVFTQAKGDVPVGTCALKVSTYSRKELYSTNIIFLTSLISFLAVVL